jgi:hypothetical protein
MGRIASRAACRPSPPLTALNLSESPPSPFRSPDKTCILLTIESPFALAPPLTTLHDHTRPSPSPHILLSLPLSPFLFKILLLLSSQVLPSNPVLVLHSSLPTQIPVPFLPIHRD